MSYRNTRRNALHCILHLELELELSLQNIIHSNKSVHIAYL